MYDIKASVFLYLTKRQKASLCTYLKSFVKMHINMPPDDILNEFLEDENYYYNIQNPHFHFVIENLENDEFIRDLKKMIDAILKDIEYKNAQKPYIEAQKEIAKNIKKQALEFKMKKEKPTFKQLKYYKNLCKNHNLEPKNTENASKYDLKIWIGEILDNAN